MGDRYIKVSRWEKGAVQIGYLSPTSVVYMEEPGPDPAPFGERLAYKDGVAVLCAGWH